MDHQGAGRTRRAAAKRRQPPWPSMDGPGYPEGSAFPGDSGFPGAASFGGPTGSLPVRSPGASPAGTGAHPVLGPGTGPNRLIGPGSGAQPTMSPGSGAQPTLGPAGSPGAAGRAPARGFSPAREPAESPTDPFGQWHTPTGPLPVQADTEDAYPPDDTGFPGRLPPADQADPAGRRRGTG